MAVNKWMPLVQAVVDDMSCHAWFERIGQAEPGLELQRVDFRWMVEHDAFQYRAWGRALTGAEFRIDQAVYDQAALDLRDLVVAELALIRIAGAQALDRFFIGLDERFGDAEDGCVSGTGLYPHEVAELPQRLVTYAGLERCLMPASERSPVLAEAMAVLSRGFWPAGWRGEWPLGEMLVW